MFIAAKTEFAFSFMANQSTKEYLVQLLSKKFTVSSYLYYWLYYILKRVKLDAPCALPFQSFFNLHDNVADCVSC